MGVRWQDRVPDTKILQKSHVQSIHALLTRSQLRWTGHIVRMPDKHLPKRLFYGELCEGKRSSGGQKKRFKDHLKNSLKQCSIDPSSWETTALDRSAWHTQITAASILAPGRLQPLIAQLDTPRSLLASLNLKKKEHCG